MASSTSGASGSWSGPRGKVRVLPIVELDSARYRKLHDLVAALEAEGVGAEVRGVPYELQRNAYQMLWLGKPRPCNNLPDYVARTRDTVLVEVEQIVQA